MAGLLVIVVALSQTSLLGSPSPTPGSTRPAPTAAARASAGGSPSRLASSASPVASAAASNASSVASPAASATPTSFLRAYQAPQVQAAPNGFLTIASLALKLAIVLGLIYATVWVLRFFSGRSKGPFASASAVSILETTRLAQNRDLYLVDVADRVLLLGATGSTIAVLTEITDPDAIEARSAIGRTLPFVPQDRG
ncbi:MAG: FliO/MopB family protein [Chloroflexota bacterium]